MMMPQITNITTPIVVIALLTGVLVGGCYNDVADVLYPGCGVPNVTYSETIQPILERECYDCHAGYSPDAELDLEGYVNAKNSVSNEKFRADLIYRLEYDTVPRMPYLLPKLDSCTIAKIKAWKAAGFPE